jgi:hypothetical protein
MAVYLAKVCQHSTVRTVDFHDLDRLGRRARHGLRLTHEALPAEGNLPLFPSCSRRML